MRNSTRAKSVARAKTSDLDVLGKKGDVRRHLTPCPGSNLPRLLNTGRGSSIIREFPQNTEYYHTCCIVLNLVTIMEQNNHIIQGRLLYSKFNVPATFSVVHNVIARRHGHEHAVRVPASVRWVGGHWGLAHPQ